MQTLWADHLDSARGCALSADEDLAAGVVTLRSSLGLFLWDFERTAAFKAAVHPKSGRNPEIMSTLALFEGTEGHP